VKQLPAHAGGANHLPSPSAAGSRPSRPTNPTAGNTVGEADPVYSHMGARSPGGTPTLKTTWHVCCDRLVSNRGPGIHGSKASISPGRPMEQSSSPRSRASRTTTKKSNSGSVSAKSCATASVCEAGGLPTGVCVQIRRDDLTLAYTVLAGEYTAMIVNSPKSPQ